MKQCIKCKETKEDKSFYVAKRNEDGLSDRCKKCVAIESREYNQAYRLANKPVDPKPGIIEAIRGAKVATKVPNCRFMCNKVAKTYKVPKGTMCVVCGHSVAIEAHIPDYGKPKKITWLCEEHHKDVHNTI